MRVSRTLSVPALVLALGPTVAGAQSAAPPEIPLRPGLTVVRAVSDARGDYETVLQVLQVGEASIDLAYAGDVPGAGPITAARAVRRDDLQQAREYRNFFTSNDTRPYPGTTALGPSRAVLADLETKGEASFACYVRRGRTYELARGVLELIGPATVSVLVNGTPVQLEVIHARADLDRAEGELWFLDHPIQPLTLRYELVARLPAEYRNLPPQALAHVKFVPDVVEVVKIEFPVEEADEPLEEALETTGRAEVYGIYFDFGSDELKVESDPVLERIAGLLGRNPDWRLAIEGHTDDVGGDAYNQDLSERRAAAVERALVERYDIAAERLSTSGFGATRPKASNETLAGRARNRRVELVRK